MNKKVRELANPPHPNDSPVNPNNAYIMYKIPPGAVFKRGLKAVDK